MDGQACNVMPFKFIMCGNFLCRLIFSARFLPSSF